MGTVYPIESQGVHTDNMVTQEFSLHHIGWITKDIRQFEAFWCENLGFEGIFESSLSRETALALFSLDTTGTIRRYRRGAMVIEVHHLDDIADTSQAFNRLGINHICLHVDNRETFIADLNDRVSVFRHRNPGGWFNIFIRDFEGNWIELRETFKGIA